MGARWVIALAVLLAGCALQRGSLEPPADEATRTNLRHSGMQFYASRCLGCHGDGAHGGWAPRLARKPLTPGLIAEATAQRCRSVIGRPIALELTPNQALAIHLYIREWR
jgi:mono/diheme cytochrome c family protein